MGFNPAALIDDAIITLARWKRANQESREKKNSLRIGGVNFGPTAIEDGEDYGYAPYTAREAARRANVPVRNIREFISDRIKTKEARDVVARAWEAQSGSVYSTGGGKYKEPFIISPSRILEEERSSWHDFAVMSHEIGHSKMYGAIPSPIRGPISFLGTTTPGILGSMVAGFGGASYAASFETASREALSGISRVTKVGAAVAVAGSLSMLASESWANIYATRQLKELNAPESAYSAVKASEGSYVALSMANIGAAGLGYAAVKESGKLFLASFAMMLSGYYLSGRTSSYFKEQAKISGHSVGWANKQNEEAVQSDFRSGNSYMPRINKSFRFLEMAIGKKSVLTLMLSSSLLFGGISQAYAKNVGVEAGRKISFGKQASAAVAERNITDLTDTIAALTDPSNQSAVALQLKRTAIAESGLKKTVQMGGGPARSIFQVEPRSAFDVLDRISLRNERVVKSLEKASGKSIVELRGMWNWQMDAALRENQLFAGTIARFVYPLDAEKFPGVTLKSGRLQEPSLESSSNFWMKGYNKSRKEVQVARKRSFVKSNMQFNAVLKADIEKTASKAGNATIKSQKMIRKALKLIPR